MHFRFACYRNPITAVTLQLKVILTLFASATVVNGDIRLLYNIKYVAIVKLRSAHLLPAGYMQGCSTLLNGLY